jgi:hypothetical protein
MENKIALFDLKEEKRELDAFLSTIPYVAAVPPAERVSEPEEILPLPAQDKPVFDDDHSEASVPEPEMPVLKTEEAPVEPSREDRVPTLNDDELVLEMEKPAVQPEAPVEPSREDRAPTLNDDEFVLEMEKPVAQPEEAPVVPSLEDKGLAPEEDRPSGLTDTVSFKAPEESAPEFEKTPSLPPLEEEEKAQTIQQPNDAEAVNPPDDIETMTRLVETVESAELEPVQPPPPEKKKKAGSKAGAYDFAPEKKSVNAGRWIGIGLVIVLLTALLVGYFWLYPERGAKTISIIKSYIPVLKNDQGAAPTSVQGINLIQIRQKRLYNAVLGKNIRVIEGIVENATPRPVSGIKIAANFYSAEGAVLASTESFAGNVVIDEKLESLDENAILSALKDPKTRDDRISFKGQMPFMVVFAGEPAGIFRMTILPVECKTH